LTVQREDAARLRSRKLAVEQQTLGRMWDVGLEEGSRIIENEQLATESIRSFAKIVQGADIAADGPNTTADGGRRGENHVVGGLCLRVLHPAVQTVIER